MLTTSHSQLRLGSWLLWGMALGSTVMITLPAPWEKLAAAADAPSSSPAIRVTAGKPQRKTIVRRTEQPGQIEAYEQTPMFAKVTGFVGKIYVDIGDRVKVGQTMAEIRVPELAAELLQKKSLVDAARAEVDQATASIKVAEAAKKSAEALVVEAAATKKRTEAERTRSTLEFERMTSLVSNQAITQKAVDESKSRLQTAEASIQEAEAKTKSAAAVVLQKSASIELAQADHLSAAAKLKVAEADQARTEVLQKYTTITAPFDGIVTARHIDVGHLVQPGGRMQSDLPLFVVIRADVVRVFIEIPEADAAHVNPENEATVRIPSLGNRTFAAKVKRTSWALHPSTRTLKAEIDLPNPDGHLRPGMYVYADVKVAEHKDAISLPKGAVLTLDTQLSCLCVSTDNTLIRRPITVGLRAADEVEVLSGLTGDENVVLTNASSYREGQKVEIALKK